MRVIYFLFVVAGLISGCASNEIRLAHSVDLVPATRSIPEEQLLDVGIAVFDSGIPEGEVDKEILEELIRDGTFVYIRRTEARYMAVTLRDTLQKSGHWGAVWVTPSASTAADVNVMAEILRSDGDEFLLYVKAVDASGRVWLDDEYGMGTAAGAYNRQRFGGLDPYQDVFSSIANDLAAVQGKLAVNEAEKIRSIAQLRFAGELSPEVFGEHVVQSNRGEYELRRLPAKGDPMFGRTQRIREREHLFVETLNQHYDQFYRDSIESYDGWRQFSREEAIAIKELQRSTRWRTGLGIATVVASVVYGSQSDGDGFSDRMVRDALMYVGMDMIRTGAVRKQEKRLHEETLEELSNSFDDEVRPMVVEIEGTQHRLTGTADVQYQEWRQLLKDLFVSETGFLPADMSIYTEPPPSELELIAVPETTSGSESAGQNEDMNSEAVDTGVATDT